MNRYRHEKRLEAIVDIWSPGTALPVRMGKSGSPGTDRGCHTVA
jgi:hypothetical protein